MNRANIFWGVLLIAMGSLVLAGNYFGFNVWVFFWPALIILVGVLLVLGSTMRATVLDSESVSIPLGQAEKAALRIRHGAGHLVIRGGAGSGILIEGAFRGGLDHTESRYGSQMEAQIQVPNDIWKNMPFFSGGWSPIDWDMKMTSAVPVTLELETGAGESRIDLRDVRAESIVLKTGASSTDLTLPAQAGNTSVQVESGVSAVNLRIPEGVAARISVESGLAGIAVDPTRFPRMGDRYQSPDYDTAINRADIQVRTGVGSVEIR
jgi:hypothetical protein